MFSQDAAPALPKALALACFTCALAACSDGAETAVGDACSNFASEVVDVAYGPGQAFGRQQMPEIVLGPPEGAGCCQGSFDVLSLGNGGEITVGFGGNRVVDGPGVDFVVFENAFETGETVFAELATISVSTDGEHWSEFPCTATAAPFGSCAGHRPVYLNGDSATSADALGDGSIAWEPSLAGGDGFDLADLGVTEAKYVRIVDRVDIEGLNGVFDLDAVGIVNASCP